MHAAPTYRQKQRQYMNEQHRFQRQYHSSLLSWEHARSRMFACYCCHGLRVPWLHLGTHCKACNGREHLRSVVAPSCWYCAVFQTSSCTAGVQIHVDGLIVANSTGPLTGQLHGRHIQGSNHLQARQERWLSLQLSPATSILILQFPKHMGRPCMPIRIHPHAIS